MEEVKNIKMEDIIIIDCEASGITPESYPIEIGISFKNGSFSFLIKPEEEWNYWCSEAEKMHNIRREELFSKGLIVKKVAKLLNEKLKGKTIFTDSVYFENMWIDKLFKFSEIEKLFNIVSIYDINFDYRKYEQYKKFLSEKTVNHRAENDANVIRESLVKSM